MATSGRPCKLTPAVEKRICKALAAGNTRTDSARLADVGLTTLMVWLRRGKAQKSGPFRQLLQAVKKAESEAVAKRVARIDAAAAKGNWQADAWWLERRRPKDFGRKDSHEVTHRGKVEHAVDLSKLSDEQLRHLQEAARLARGSPPALPNGSDRN